MDFLTRASAIQDQLIAWRRDIHMHPELSFQEVRTSRLVADTLRDMGIEVEVGVAETGVIGRIGNGKGRTIGIRADMDALPIDEANDVPYKSQTPGVMHACGHDAHTAILLGVAKMLTETELPDGEIRLLFQPSEEAWRESDGHSGGSLMVQENALAGVDNVIALHVASQYPAGQVYIADGYFLAAVDTFEIVIKGQGGHGAYPHETIDPIYLQAQVVNAIQGIRARRLNPTAASVITIGSIHGGTAPNVIPNEVTLVGTIRSFDADVRDQLHDELDRACSVARALGGDYTLHISKGYPSLYNDPAVAAKMRHIAAEMTDPGHVFIGTPQMGAEDFAYMTQQAPGAMMMLGAKYDEQARPHHNPNFDISESSLHLGAAILAETALQLLQSAD